MSRTSTISLTAVKDSSIGKKCLSLSMHKEDFGLTVEWNFFSASHGKGAVDGVGSTIKRLARQYMLRETQIAPKSASEFVQAEMKFNTSIKVFYIDKSHIRDTREKNGKRTF